MSNTLVLKNSVTQNGPVPITILFFQKFFGDQPDGPEVANTPLAPGQAINIPFAGGSGSGDYYSFSIYWGADGEYIVADENRKRCDIELDDISSPSPIVVEFFAATFSVGTPLSPGCFNTPYGTVYTSPTPP